MHDPICRHISKTPIFLDVTICLGQVSKNVRQPFESQKSGNSYFKSENGYLKLGNPHLKFLTYFIFEIMGNGYLKFRHVFFKDCSFLNNCSRISNNHTTILKKYQSLNSNNHSPISNNPYPILNGWRSHIRLTSNSKSLISKEAFPDFK